MVKITDLKIILDYPCGHNVATRVFKKQKNLYQLWLDKDKPMEEVLEWRNVAGFEDGKREP